MHRAFSFSLPGVSLPVILINHFPAASVTQIRDMLINSLARKLSFSASINSG